MPSSATLTSTDPDAYFAAIRNAQVKCVVTGRGDFHAKLTRIDLFRLWLLRGEESLARTASVSIGKRAAILFVTGRSELQYVNGRMLSHGEILLYGSDAVALQRTSAGCQWSTMSLTLEDLAAAGEIITGREMTAPSDTFSVRPAPQLMMRLRKLHEATDHLARTAPDIFAKPEVARALEDALVHAMIGCISGGEATEITSTYRYHSAIVRRLEEVLEANIDRAVYIGELCQATRVSEKTLRLCCQEQLGMSPKQFLLRRRMHLAHRALRRANAATTTVSEIATNYGFWEFGRFSAAYRSAFGESPSVSLRRPPEEPQPWKNISSPWQLPESA